YANGCEVDTSTDVANCGGCSVDGSHACPTTNDTSTCVGGICGVTCNSGYGNCAGTQATAGCPDAITCSTCCSSGASGTCSGGGSCNAGSCAASTLHVCGEENEGASPVTVTCPPSTVI